MKTKLCVLFFFVFGLSILVIAQTKQDVVYLKNGSMIRGQIIEKIVDKHIKIQTVDGSIWVFKFDEVDRITEEENMSGKPKERNYKTKGYFSMFDVGMLDGTSTSGYYNRYSFSTHFINGYQFNNKVSCAFGIGFEHIDKPLAPMFVEGRYNFFKGKTTPFVYLQTGLAFPLQSREYYYYGDGKNKTGFMINPGIGIKNYIGNNTAIVFSIGYRYHQQKTVYDNGYLDWNGSTLDGTTERVYIYRRMSIRIGFLFN